MEIIQQVEALLLGAVPTVLLFIVLVFCYQMLVQGPLTRTLAARRALTAGAVENAHAAIAEAEERAAEYAEKLRQARAEIYKLREQRTKQRSAEREAALEVTRKAAGSKVSLARAEVDAEAEKARLAIQGSAADLARQVVAAVLPLAAGGSR
jgi:F-type H+-transporting ATPase subunit b